MVNLTKHLKKLWERSPDAPYFNVEILKYKLRSKGLTFCPLQVISHWRCEPSSTWLKIDYKYSPRGLSSIQPLKNLSFSASIDGKVSSIRCSPTATWLVDYIYLHLYLYLFLKSYFHFYSALLCYFSDF
jgi:hypothetical protein